MFSRLELCSAALSFVLTFLFSWALIRLSKRHRIGIDSDKGEQKVHTDLTPRIGGLAIFLSSALTISINKWHESGYLSTSELIIICALPVYILGTAEDLTQRVSIQLRMLGALVSSLMVIFIVNINVIRTDFPGVDELLHFPIIMILISILVIVGFTNAMNIIDGFHGLALTQAMSILFFIGLSYFMAGDYEMWGVSKFVFLACLSLLAWNWPRGLIFLGDGGAYFLGFLCVCLGLHLLKSTLTVSPVFVINLGLYPLLDTLYSMFRRKINRTLSITKADSLHLHSLIYKSLNQYPDKHKLRLNVNACVCFLILGVTLPICIVSYLNRSDDLILFSLFLSGCFSYLFIYRYLRSKVHIDGNPPI